jgi:choline dehydrogenase-like flavoprotein
MLALTESRVTYDYKSTPQTHLNGREIHCWRGRGLGGSSANNYCGWLRGDKSDFNTWADIVGDETWRWEGEGGVEQRFRKIENLHLTETQANALGRELSSVHSEGNVDLSFGKEWPEIGTTTMEAAKELGVCHIVFV